MYRPSISTRYPFRICLTSVEDGIVFDINGDGVSERVAWTQAGSEVAYLAYDKNDDGIINDGQELVGSSAVDGAPTAVEALRIISNSHTGTINSEVPFFARLLLWTDQNHNGISEPSELRPASEILADVGMGYFRERRQDGNGNEYRFRGFVHVRTAPGVNRARDTKDDEERRRSIYEVAPAIR
jgi:hypothetical protein